VSHTDQEKWDARYRSGSYSTRVHPSTLLKEWLPRVSPSSGRPAAIDVACGVGRNAVFLAQQGWQVDALDISGVALDLLAARAGEQGLPIACHRVDLDDWREQAMLRAGQSYDLAILFRYADLGLVEALADVVKPGGYLIAEKHLVTTETVVGPSSARFRVKPGALKLACQELELIWYDEGLVLDPDGRRAALARVVARRPGG
jgi:SAM-dependent methyltransferase